MADLKQAVEAIKAGNKKTGRQLLVEIIKAEPDNEMAWLWMSKTITALDKQRKCLERVLQINSDNEAAKKVMAAIDEKELFQEFKESPAPAVQRPVQTIVIQQKKRNRTVTILALISLFVILCICGSFVLSSLSSPGQTTTTQSAPTALTPTATPAQTATPSFRGNIKISPQKLINHFEYNYSFTWRESVYDDGSHKFTGQSPDRKRKINIWTESSNTEDIRELFFSFRFPYDNGDEQRKAGVDGLVNILLLTLPDQYDEGIAFTTDAFGSDESEVETRIDGVEFSVLQGPGDDDGNEFLVIFSIVDAS